MKSVNKVILVGFAGNDPEVKYTAGGIPVGRFSLATNERFKDKSGKFQDRKEWHNVVAWQRLAEIVGEFVSKGSHSGDPAGLEDWIFHVTKSVEMALKRDTFVIS